MWLCAEGMRVVQVGSWSVAVMGQVSLHGISAGEGTAYEWQGRAG